MKRDAIWQSIEEGRKDHTCLPFWSWNDRLEPEEIRRQIEAMRKAGIGGYFMHARGGLETPYMGEEWMEAIRAGLDAAGEMEAWAYDENGWPSGFADGTIPRKGWEYQQKGLQPLTVGRDSLEGVQVLGAYRLTAEGDMMMADRPADGDLAVACAVNAYYIDALDPKVIRAFLEETHERYHREFGPDFGGKLKGFFTDEPQYANGLIPWSPVLEEAYEARYGEALRPLLGWLFLDGERTRELRIRYFSLAGELYRESFLKQIYDWCEEHGCQLTGHVMAEDSLFSQLACTGGAMPCYDYFHMPGIDWLGRDIASPMIPKQLGSAAAQLGKERTLTESFALCGWDVSFNELRRIAQWQFVNGVNRICQHLAAYTLRGSRKRDYPPSLHVQQPWFTEYAGFNDTFSRLGSALAQGSEEAEVLLLEPMQAASAVYDRRDPGPAMAVNRGFEEASVRLDGLHIGHHYGDETLMSRYGRVKGDRLEVGRMSYRAVLLPPCATLPRRVAELLLEFVRSGGRLYGLGELPHEIDGRRDPLAAELSGCVEPLRTDGELREKLCADHALSVWKDGGECLAISCMVRRLSDGRRLYFVVNNSLEELGECRLSVSGDIALLELDCSRAEEREQPAEDSMGRTVWTAAFAPAESHLWIEVPAGEREKRAVLPRQIRRLPLDGAFELKESTPNLLTLDACEYRIDAGEWQAEKALILLQRELLERQQSCSLELRFRFRAEDAAGIGDLSLAMETPERYTLRLNGQPVAFRDQGYFRDTAFRLCDIRPYLREGENELLVSGEFRQSQKVYDVLFGENVHESEKNKLTLDTELESLYLVGGFGVALEGEFHREKRRAIRTHGAFRLTPPVSGVDIRDITTGGFWFFAGRMLFAQSVTVRREADTEYVVELDRLNAPAAAVWVNGKKAGTLGFAPYRLPVTDLLRDGENLVEIELCSGNRNWLGPHHRAAGESYLVAPDTFTDRKDWTDEPAPYWSDDFCFVEFGACP